MNLRSISECCASGLNRLRTGPSDWKPSRSLGNGDRRLQPVELQLPLQLACRPNQRDVRNSAFALTVPSASPSLSHF